MKLLSRVVVGALLVGNLCLPGFSADKKKPLTAAEVFKRSVPAIVAIDCLGANSAKIGTASGFVIAPNGKVVTNFHVIQRCESLSVRLSNGDAYDASHVLQVDPMKDLAVIRIKAASLPALTMGDSAELQVGDVVYSIGNPNGLQNTLQQGLVSAFRDVGGIRLVQVSASINLGNSGGPILDSQAHVVAVSALKIVGSENLGFAIPVNYVKSLPESKGDVTFASFAAAMKLALANAKAVAPPPPPPPGGRGIPNYGDPLAKMGPTLIAPPSAPALVFNRIDSFAGRAWRFEAEGLPARQVQFGQFHGVALDRAGNIYASDLGNQAIVKIDATGRTHVLAGPDSAPQNRPVTPQQLTLDSAGNVYFADAGQRIRKILPSGEVVTVAGSDNRRGDTPDGSPALGAPLNDLNGVVIASDGSIIFSEWSGNRVRRVDPHGILQTVAGDGQSRFAGDGGPAPQASLSRPNGLALDAEGNLYIADQWNGRVRKVSRDGTISTVLGGGVGGQRMNCPTGLTVDAKGALFVADPCARRVFALRHGEGSILGGSGNAATAEPAGVGGPALTASFDEWAVAADDRGDVIVAAPDYGYLYKLGHDDGVLSIIAGAGNWRTPTDGMHASSVEFQAVTHLAFDNDGGLIVPDFAGNRLYRIDRNGVAARLAGFANGFSSQDNIAARDSGLDRPTGVRVRPNGAIVVVEWQGSRIREITPDGKIHTLAGNGRRNYSGDGGPAVNASFNRPTGICLDGDGAIYVADTDNNRVRKVLLNGTIELVAGNGTSGYSGDGGPAERASLRQPVAVQFGPDGSLYIADAGNHRIRRVTSSGVITTVAGDGANRNAGDGGPALKASLVWPYDLALGPDHALYFTDSNAFRVRRIDLASWTVTTVAGNGNFPISGDGGRPLAAGLGRVEALAFDSNGNLYLGDVSAGRIRVLKVGSMPVAASAGVPGGVMNAGAGGGIGSMPAQRAPGAIQVSTDKLETFLRGKLGVWGGEDATTILGAVTDRRQDAQDTLFTFQTPNTGFSRVTLHFGGGGKLSRVDFFPAQKQKWDVQLAYMKEKFSGDNFQIEQRGENIAYTYNRSRTSFLVQPDGSIVSMTIF